MKYLLAICILLLSTVAFADIEVVGDGTATLTPDIAHITIAVVTEAKSPVDALADNNAQSIKLYAYLTAAKISASDVQTVDLVLQPTYVYEKEVTKLTGYAVRNQLTITVRDLSILGTLLTALAGEGANRLGDLQFAASDTSKAQDAARIAAMKNAHHKAQVLARTAGITLGKLIAASESSYPTPRYDMPRAAAPGGTPTSAGQLTITIHVAARYETAAPYEPVRN